MRRLRVFLVLCVFPLIGLAAQQQILGTTSADGGLSSALAAKADFATASEGVSNRLDTPQDRALVAATNPDYPVTPGDRYTLSFLKATEQSSLTLFVESDYFINLAIFGKLNASGIGFRDLKYRVEALVERSYPGSCPSLLLTSTGIFNVKVEGEVVTSGLIEAWGLTRLSELVSRVKTPYASTRLVSVVDANGKEKSYDLFKASRSGDLSQDPYVRPGDRIILSRYERSVSVSGQVRRPGTYQLLAGEGLRDLIEVYGDGFAEEANPSLLALERHISVKGQVGERHLLDYAKDSAFLLNNADILAVPPNKDLLPCIYFEGALGVGVNGQSPEAARRLPYTFYPGETLSQATQRLRDQFSAVSDLDNAYVKRAGGQVSVNLSKFLYAKEFSNDMPLVTGDTVIVPFRQFFVSVAGAVKIPGRYPYVPDRGWEYYVNLAGGIDQDKNGGNALKISDVYGKPCPQDRLVQPEDSIYVESNSFLYWFGKVAGIVSTIVSVSALIVSLF